MRTPAPAAVPLVEGSASGSWVHTGDGRRLLNCGGFGVTTFGASPPSVVSAVANQLATLPVGVRTIPHGLEDDARRAVLELAPDGLEEVTFAVTGTEATELALRLARLNRCTRFVSTDGGFHGRTIGALSVRGDERTRRLYRPLLPDVEVVPYGDASAVERALGRQSSRAAVIVEPVQGEAGVVIPPPGYLATVAAACARHGALLVVDEIQTGLGRLGRLWGVDRDGVEPDLLLAGKALGGGVVPVSAVLATAAAARPFLRDPRQASSTFGAYPLGAAAVIAVAELLRDGQVVRRAGELGQRVAAILRRTVEPARGGVVRDVRGVGLLHGIELGSAAAAQRFADELIAAGVLPSYSMGSSATIRLTPPATLGEEELRVLEDALGRAVARVGNAGP
jgi:putrescine aminotransferase